MKAGTILIDKIPGKGEDSNPISIETKGDGLVGCFDGLGGAGSTKYNYAGQQFSGAWYASRLSRVIVLNHFKSNYSDFGIEKGEEWVGKCTEILQEGLKRSVDFLETQKSLLVSKMIRRLPTTFSGALYSVSSEKELTILSINLGDSRTYILSPKKGLQQITRDTTVQPKDAYQAMKEGTRISSSINADFPFEFETNKLESELPLVIISASDGVFDYPHHPVLFEHLILQALINSSSMEDWTKNIESGIPNPQDDVSMVIKPIGWEKFEKLKNSFTERYAEVEKRFVTPLFSMAQHSKSTPLSPEDYEAKRTEIWNDYKINYADLIPIEKPVES